MEVQPYAHFSMVAISTRNQIIPSAPSRVPVTKVIFLAWNFLHFQTNILLSPDALPFFALEIICLASPSSFSGHCHNNKHKFNSRPSSHPENNIMMANLNPRLRTSDAVFWYTATITCSDTISHVEGTICRDRLRSPIDENMSCVLELDKGVDEREDGWGGSAMGMSFER
ncbi:hypothetical protein BC938DRAFT_479432 [Jimgerdemannia flammicorona]|uniref:Uncharacterized protein n=1 Tax=Jimgerdemannia flammicorona TaxID=994334 RepID=A0A433QKT2_9FUNG|nr:hypothetical protein BC938DRAFT_479432 [Jimgerdemannia flammicorona]